MKNLLYDIYKFEYSNQNMSLFLTPILKSIQPELKLFFMVLLMSQSHFVFAQTTLSDRLNNDFRISIDNYDSNMSLENYLNHILEVFNEHNSEDYAQIEKLNNTGTDPLDELYKKGYGYAETIETPFGRKSFYGDIAETEINNKSTLFDRSNNQIATYDIIFNLKLHTYDLPIMVTKNFKYGYIDRTGKVIVPIKYNDASDYAIDERLAAVCVNNKCGYIDERGIVKIPMKYTAVGDFSDGLAPVAIQQRLGYIDKEGKLIIPMAYNYTETYSNMINNTWNFNYGSAWVKKGKKWGMIDMNGNSLTDFIYNDPINYGYYSKAKLDNGYEKCFDALGREYANLNDVYKQQRKIKEDAAQQGSRMAQYETAKTYLWGIYFEKIAPDYFKSFTYFKQAAEQGNIESNAYLGYMLLKGLGCTADQSLAYAYATKAAQNGNYLGLHLLGYMNAYGIGTIQNIEEAKKWYQKAAEQGCTYSKNELANLNNNPTPSSIPTSTLSPTLNNMITIEWPDFKTLTCDKVYKFTINIKSNNEVKSCDILVNGEQLPGVNVMDNDGYALVTIKNVILREGVNTIKVIVANTLTQTTSEKIVTYLAEQYSDNSSIKPEKRIALVIGNSAYSGYPLNNPVNDALDIANKLESLGFKVICSIDATHETMEHEIANFGQQALDYDVALFYYSGHGIQSKGINYLVPIDADLPEESVVKFRCTDLNLIFEVMAEAKVPMKIIVLDACRNNPFTRSWTRGANNNGLICMNAPSGSFIAFSTAPGEVALDGLPEDRNSPYTKAFLETLEIPNLRLSDFLENIYDKVYNRTDKYQTPWYSAAGSGSFIFNKK